MGYTIIFLDSALERDLPSLPKTVRSRVISAIKERLTVDPINLGEVLHHSLKGCRRLRVGDYRTIYHVNTAKYEVTIVTIGHRDTIYEKARKILRRH
ncbi:MAG: type II toxin-antitoxin system RelE/ParE family toxin [Wolbachia endosymbiont of Andrena praecox]|uniref:type II toxin-antitoxin system RelE family toxin n=1 Tax=unclassified Wolbachia TaxID=2640676 RepID=UPI0007EED05D|nr:MULTISPECIES: type II toxin-antitoxin system RelE/ParE family toxin [unclassified Wolbachia]MDX5487949.1 type II toxin-antitoxin system RelE/ParE family toxin [Wolbachia endosymbiont of Andrena praecox]MDX5496640.1 type II toxin-antitoxin system RelE/ParE family toxin [Wolbachia endosymbiont of Nomada fabriciana]MDX5518644.1 type II toxin-antitoxin system RelE/ParE family toxin [Wolbachia endosymbiont of Andrena agilissima]MDX5528025.1 type II toxin-antitoxin system RelE/ParE family toxin [W